MLHCIKTSSQQTLAYKQAQEVGKDKFYRIMLKSVQRELTATLKVSLQWMVDTMLPFDVLATVVIVDPLTVAIAWT